MGYQLAFLQAQTKPLITAKCASSRYADGRVPDQFFDQLMGLCWSQRTLEHHTNASWSPLVHLCPPAAILPFPLLEVEKYTRSVARITAEIGHFLDWMSIGGYKGTFPTFLEGLPISASALGIRPKCGVSDVLVKSFRVVKRWCRETPWCVVAVSRTRPPSYSSEREAVRP